MGFKAGLVGLPNVGKSTLFNALTKSSVPAENYPFCTIDPHVAITPVPDPRLPRLLELFKSKEIIPATTTFVDIAGLVKGAAKGEGLGNQFLGNITQVDLILHVLRCFEDSNIIKAEGVIDPIADYDVIITELMLKDLDTVNKRREKLPRLLKAANNPIEKKELEQENAVLPLIETALNNGDVEKVRALWNEYTFTAIPLLSAKKFLIIANIAEDEIGSYQNNTYYQQLVQKFGKDIVIPISARFEQELIKLDPESAQEMMDMYDLKESGLHQIIRASYTHLGLITFFTCGPKEIHAWPIKKGTTVRTAAGEIHSDLERGFISADVYNCKDLFELGSEAKVREAGKLQRQGQDYIVADGDILSIKFNV